MSSSTTIAPRIRIPSSLLWLLLLLLMQHIALTSALSIPTLKGTIFAPSSDFFFTTSASSSDSQKALPAPKGSPECTNGGNLYCCGSFIQSGSDGPCRSPEKVDIVQQCRKREAHGMACCINEVRVASIASSQELHRWNGRVLRSQGRYIGLGEDEWKANERTASCGVVLLVGRVGETRAKKSKLDPFTVQRLTFFPLAS